MKINELIAEPQIDEGVGDIIGKTGGHVIGATQAAVRGLKGMWKDAKAGYAAGKSAWDPKDAATGIGTSTPTASGGTAPASGGTAPASGGTAPASGGTAPAQPAGDISSILQTIDKLDQPAKQQLASELEKSIGATSKPVTPTTTTPTTTTPTTTTPTTTTPTTTTTTTPTTTTPTASEPATPAAGGTTYDPKKAAADKIAKGQADQQLAQQQMKATADANATKSAEDAAIKAAADAAKAKSGFQQTLADTNAIKAAADKGIREAEEKKKKLKKKKLVAEFKSKFLGMTI